MDRYSILGEESLPLESEIALPRNVVEPPAPSLSPNVLRFPGEDGGQSLSDMAERDLDAALQLLAERAHYITSASGAAIGMLESGEMICRASAGSLAPPPGTHLATGSGLSVMAAQRRQMLRCDNALEDPRTNQGNCRRLGIISAMATPLLLNDAAVGAFELVSGSPRAFEDHDVAALQRLAEMIETAMQHAYAARHADAQINGEVPFDALSLQDEELSQLAARAVGAPEPASDPGSAEFDMPAAGKSVAIETQPPESVESAGDHQPEDAANPWVERGNIRVCGQCGFPVSGSRDLCIDCEAAARKSGALPALSAAEDSSTLTFGADGLESEESWFTSHKFVLAGLFAAILLIAVLLWLR